MTEAKHVYVAISAITGIMAGEGISKSRKNEQQGYKFRGIDDVYAALSRHLSEQKLCILPRVVERSTVERPTKSGGVSTYTTLTVEFDLVSAVDGSTHTIRTVGEAMDTADKSSNKAQSAAMKYACLLAFQIPTEGDNDTENHHHEKARPASLEGVLADSIALVEWEKASHARLLSAVTMGDLKEAWAAMSDEAKRKGIPDSAMRKLGAAKDQMKAKLAPANGASTAAQ